MLPNIVEDTPRKLHVHEEKNFGRFNRSGPALRIVVCVKDPAHIATAFQVG